MRALLCVAIESAGTVDSFCFTRLRSCCLAADNGEAILFLSGSQWTGMADIRELQVLRSRAADLV